MADEEKVLFSLDDPTTNPFASVGSPFMLSGWIIPAPANLSVGIEVKVEGQVRARTTTGLRRQDVESAYPQREGALWSGFATEVFVDDWDGREVEVAVKAVFGDGEMLLTRFQAKVEGLVRLVSPRQRDWRYLDILACPGCLGTVHETESSIECLGCKRTFPKRRDTPIFACGSDMIQSRLLETTPTNPNGEDQTRIIKENALVLDLGAGNPRESEHHPNVVFHEFVHYLHDDVVSTCDRLPYREGIFDAVISKAAFEHLARPWDVADEIYRVLKPGGIVHVDTAFMFPLHGDPYHFFNMTLDGAREIFKRFNTLRCGIQPYQNPSKSLRVQIDIFLEHLRSEDWRRRFKELGDAIGDNGNGLDDALDPKGREKLAAGVFFEGTKPFKT